MSCSLSEECFFEPGDGCDFVILCYNEKVKVNKLTYSYFLNQEHEK